MSSPNSHVILYLDYYMALANSPEFAVLLRGKWGSGKSWFIKKYMATRADDEFIYVSLYGVATYSEIEDAFFAQLHPFLAHKSMKLAGKLLKGALKATVKIDLDDKAESISFNGGLPPMRLQDYLTKLDGKTLVFDDLERCAIPIYQVLGYINQYVENSGVKVLIIANEDEIINADVEARTSENARRYLTIKEKLIGKSFDIESDDEAALTEFISLAENEQCREFLKKNTFLIFLLFAQAGYKNLRHLKQTILDFDRLYFLLNKPARESNELMRLLLNLFLAVSFEIKKGVIHEDDVHELFTFTYTVKKEDDQKSAVQRIRLKYPVFKNDNSYLLSGEIWTGLFKTGIIDRSVLNVELEESVFLRKAIEEPAWKRLYFFTNLEENEYETLYKQVTKEFTAMTMDNPYEIIQVTGLMIYLSQNYLAVADPDWVADIGLANLSRLAAMGELDLHKLRGFPDDHSHGLGYAGIGISIFENFLKKAQDLVIDNEEKNLPNRANEIFELLRSSAMKFKSRLDPQEPDNVGYTRTAILHLIDPIQFAAVMSTLGNRDLATVYSVLESRYSYGYSFKLNDEREWLIKVRQELVEILSTMSMCIGKHLILNKVIPALNNCVKVLPEIDVNVVQLPATGNSN